ncbi:MAG TPA: CCA tRNA nucleotidyltransferase [Pseudolabrys sp.]|jgi:poly(A) polymerase|nr:CCA tRNA nucleotidyltransferase [Pseudolabrys sp.]
MPGRTDRKLDAAWLESGALPRLLDVLDRDGEEARVIGGAVRNTLLGLPVHEFDVATTAVPEEVARRAEAAGFKAVPTGIEHGTITVVVGKQTFEVTTLRRDVETDGRHAKVAFGRDWRGDAHRRDFTINAFSVTRDGALYDYAGGLTDLEARRVRFIGDPRERIREDYLRILRFFRFHAAYGHNHPDAEGLAACIAARDGLDALSRERVRMELMKLLVAPGAAPTLVVMANAGLLLRALGGVPYLASFARMVEIETAIGEAPDAVRRLGALGVAIVEDAERLWQKLRLTNAEHTRISAMGEHWPRLSPAAGEQTARALLYRLKPQAFSDSALLAWARAQAAADDAAWRSFATLPQRWTAPMFPIKAADFIARGIAPGPALGVVLRAAEEAWIAADFPQEENALDAIRDAAVVSVAK